MNKAPLLGSDVVPRLFALAPWFAIGSVALLGTVMVTFAGLPFETTHDGSQARTQIMDNAKQIGTLTQQIAVLANTVTALQATLQFTAADQSQRLEELRNREEENERFLGTLDQQLMDLEGVHGPRRNRH